MPQTVTLTSPEDEDATDREVWIWLTKQGWQTPSYGSAAAVIAQQLDND